MLFLWSRLFVCGGFTNCPGHIGARQAVLRRGDAVRQRLTRHLLSVELNLDYQASNMVLPPQHTHIHTRTHTEIQPPASIIPAALEGTTERQQ